MPGRSHDRPRKTGRLLTEQRRVNGRVEMINGHQANIALLQLKHSGDGWQLVQIHSPPAALPHTDGFRRDIERLGDIGQVKVELLTATAQDHVEWCDWFVLCVHNYMVSLKEAGYNSKRTSYPAEESGAMLLEPRR